MGPWQGLTRDEVAERFPDQYAAWMAGDRRGRGGEEPGRGRPSAPLAALADLPPAAVAVVVTHGGTAGRRSSACSARPRPPPARRPLANCHWTELRSRATRWRLYAAQRRRCAARGAARRTCGARGRRGAGGAPATDADAV